MTIVDLDQVKEQRAAPDADCLLRNSKGQRMGVFGFEYRMGDQTFVFQLDALDYEDAEKRLAAICQGVTFLGQLHRTGNY
ncbi:hypothetical protein [Ensifer canadensis]